MQLFGVEKYSGKDKDKFYVGEPTHIQGHQSADIQLQAIAQKNVVTLIERQANQIVPMPPLYSENDMKSEIVSYLAKVTKQFVPDSYPKEYYEELCAIFSGHDTFGYTERAVTAIKQ